MRKILIINLETVDRKLLQGITSSHWEVYATHEIDRCRELLSESGFEVGLVLLPQNQQDSIPSWIIDIIIAQRQMRWVVVLPELLLRLETVISLLSEYCHDYQVLPVEPQRLLFALDHASRMAQLNESRNRRLCEFQGQYGLIGNSPAMQALFHQIGKAASVDVPVLITGESGTGKEQTARAIHEHSSRSQGPFVVVNCATLQATLIQSELFGHEKGAYTGAHKRRIGRIEMAAGGTLFLDEVGDLPLALQANLLRFLQEKTIERLGGRKSITVDTRVIAATNIPLEKAIQEGNFREDLYYRLNVLQLRTPRLYDREGDLELLAQFFFAKFAAETKTVARRLSQEALNVIASYTWPGNVRELINRLRQGMLLSQGLYLTPTDLGLERRSPRRGLMTLDEFRMAAEREAVYAALRRTRYQISRTSRELGISRNSVYRLMERYSIKRDVANDK